MNIRYLLCAVALTGSLSAMHKFNSPKEQLDFALCASDDTTFERNVKEVEAAITKGKLDITSVLNFLAEKVKDKLQNGENSTFYRKMMRRLLASKKFCYNPLELEAYFWYGRKLEFLGNARQLVLTESPDDGCLWSCSCCKSINLIDQLLFIIDVPVDNLFYWGVCDVKEKITEPLDISNVLCELSKRIKKISSVDDKQMALYHFMIQQLLASNDKFYYYPARLDQKFLEDCVIPIEAELAAEKQAADAAAAK